MMMRRIVIGVGLLVCIGLGVLWWRDRSEHTADVLSANVALWLPADAESGQFARAIEPYTWQFPADYGAHPNYQTEWWYYTGNLADETGRRFGFQFTVFRRAITPTPVESTSEWRTNQLYMAHFTVTDVEGDQFFQDQRFSRGASGLAGATTEPVYRVWLDDWAVSARDSDALVTMIQAHTAGFGIDLQLEQVKPPAPQGNGGLSAKSSVTGNASYYYSLSRLLTEGTVTLAGTDYTVSGMTWMDHEFSTSALSEQAQGWDWFGLQLDDNRELMVGQIRLVEGGIESAFGGLLIMPDGSTRYLASSDFTIEATDTWISSSTQTEYPSGWRISVQTDDPAPLELVVTPLVRDQELVEGAIIYWEGAVSVTEDATGYGYAELTGYRDTMRGRF